ncbi:conserved protein, unknown function [Plasmodium chabaudi chabaudi]|uniref:Uncharacterized protein n=1 Tax=Plasmodium chabaudi chabaudi TaxID=31271 RepID=A0A4V0K2M5_PLACU|nr:conserved protein, unknown function [Plasmodium chabaudi chabaudi]VTZ67087.1 conserved protein, unknown function [Plasmodium chabaudi chabaudi]|eukprot:XP_744785.2 conserved Plasmodium membrane protein, unknown function [Plasmodium chabaudi chabaudi]
MTNLNVQNMDKMEDSKDDEHSTMSYYRENVGNMFEYIFEMIRCKNKLRRLQLKINLYCIKRFADIINNTCLLVKVMNENYVIINKDNIENVNNKGDIYKVIFLWLLFLYIISFVTFYFRKFFIMNMVPDNYDNLFSLYKVFQTIKNVDSNNISVLEFFEKFQKTYFIINKFFEDIPQFFLCLLFFILNGKDYFLIFTMICPFVFFSAGVLSQGLGLSGLLRSSLWASLHSIDDIFIKYDAAPPNMYFLLYSSIVFFGGSIVTIVVKNLVTLFWIPYIYLQFLALLLMSSICLLLFLYSYYFEEESFYLNPYYSL